MLRKPRIAKRTYYPHAPRFSSTEFLYCITSKESFEAFKLENKNTKIKTQQEFRSYIKTITNYIVENSIIDPDGVKLPKSCGYLNVQFLNPRMDRPLREGEYLFLETQGKTAKIVWKRDDSIKYNKGLKAICFDPEKSFKIKVAEFIEKHPNHHKIVRSCITFMGDTLRKYRNLKKSNDEQRTDISS